MGWMPLSGAPHLPCIRMTPVAEGCAQAVAGRSDRTTSSARQIFIGGYCRSSARGRLLRRLCRRCEESVLRPRQAKILAQCAALVLFAEQAAPLQLGHDQIDEIVEPARQ